MKKFVLAALAATLVATPALAAAPQSHHNQPSRTVVKQVYKPAPQHQYRSWKKGQRFDSRYARNYRQIDYRQVRGLRAPPRGYHYVRSGNDVVLVGLTSGLIAAVFANMIR